jgi:hypothetical protein
MKHENCSIDRTTAMLLTIVMIFLITELPQGMDGRTAAKFVSNTNRRIRAHPIGDLHVGRDGQRVHAVGRPVRLAVAVE